MQHVARNIHQHPAETDLNPKAEQINTKKITQERGKNEIIIFGFCVN